MKDKSVILVVDDQPENTELLEAHLVPQGYEVVKAASGEEALKILSGNQIDLVLLDIKMPRMSGFEVLEKIRADKKTQLIPIIMVTALKEAEDRVKALDAGCDDFISKPFDRNELLARIKSLLRISSQHAEIEEAGEYAENIINTVREPLIILDKDLRVVTACRSFYDFFKVKPEETVGQLIYDLGNKQWNIPGLRELLEEILPKNNPFDNYEVEHDFATIGRRVMLLNARQIERAMGKERIILLAIEDITECKAAEFELSRYRQGLEKIVAGQTVELNEQVKEIGCLYAVLSLFTKPFKSIDEVLKSAVYLIPSAWRYPEFCRARIVFEGREFAAEDFRETTWKQSADIVLSGETVGTVEVCYLEEMPALDNGPFRKEERSLMDELARQLAGMVQRELAHARLEHINSVLQSLRNINQLIVHAKRRGPLIQMACKNLAHARDLRGVWIVLTGGLPDRVEGAQTGFNDIAFSELLNLFQRGETPACFCHGQTEPGVNVTNDSAAACRNCPLADTYEGSGAITIELKHGNRRYGCMGISVPIKFANDKEEASLFEEIAGDIAYALASIEQEEALRKSQHLLDARTRIASAFLSGSDEDIFGDALDIVLSLMQSEFGAFGYIDENGDYVVPSMTRHIWDKCRVPEKNIRFPRDTWGDSLWCRAIREKRTFHSNQPFAKLPTGHIPVHRYAAVPIVYQGEVIGLLQVANKETDYDASDIHVLETMSDVIAPILNTRLQRDREERLRIGAEGAVKEAEKRYREIFEGTAEGILVADLEARRFRYCNPAICEMLGYSEVELIELDVTDIHPKESLDHVLSEFEAQARGDKLLAPSLPCLRKDGSVIYADVHATSAVIDGLECSVGFFTDVTQRRQVEAQLHQAQKMESVGNLAGGIAHDFNNILTSVIGFTELSLDEVEKGTHIEDNLKEIYTAGKRAKDLVRQILAFARQSEEEVKPIQVDMIATEVLKFIRSSIPTTIEIKQNIEGDSLIMGNATQVHQVLMNLFTNAAHAMEDKGGVLEFNLKDVVIDRDVKWEKLDLKPGNYIEIKVSDTGVGIAPEIMGSIFDPYFTTKGIGEGTGMGLAMVYGIIENCGGKISVDSKPGQGTLFTIYLPVTRKRQEHQPYQPETLPTGKERILFVDDEASIAKMGGQALERLGYTVSMRTSSIDALELFRTKPNDFDLVITDMTMPNMPGDRLAIELMKIRPDIPVILCTGYSKQISDDSATAIGIKAFIYKPIVRADLSKTVRKVLDEAKRTTHD